VPENVEEIVAVGAGALNLVSYVDATDMVVGVEQTETKWGKLLPYNQANPSLREKQVIGPNKGGDAELIANAEPDLVVGTFFEAGAADDLQSKIDRPVVVIRSEAQAHDEERFFERLRRLGSLLGRSQRAEAVVSYYESQLAALDERTADVPAGEKSAAYIAGRSKGGGAGVTSTQESFAPFKYVNAKNAVQGIEGYANVSSEKLLEWDPDVIFVAGSNQERVLEELGQSPFDGLTAVQDGEVYGILPSNFYAVLWGNLLVNATFVGSVLFPEQFSGVDIQRKANDIYEHLHGEPVYDKQQSAFGGLTALDP
jgi:iron complex transport system substrate-binding protein